MKTIFTTKHTWSTKKANALPGVLHYADPTKASSCPLCSLWLRNTMKNDLEKRIHLKDNPVRGELLPRMESIVAVSLRHGNHGTNRSGYLTPIPESIAQV
jgi:hypothetical protein